VCNVRYPHLVFIPVVFACVVQCMCIRGGGTLAVYG
jgi:hypothetical protein